ncbi:6033_t:CDS:1, partial [Racocetra persica]
TDFSESINSSLVDFENTNNISIELVASDTELSSETDPTDEQDLQISVGDFYNSWDEAEACLKNYTKATGFSLRRKRVIVNVDGEVRRCTFECTHS